jgi:hypothetical protein
MKKFILTLLTVLAAMPWATAQNNVAINTTGAAAAVSAMLDVSSTTTGMLVPRMTTAQRTAIATPATGLFVYDNTLNAFWYFDGTVWRPFLSNLTGWTTTGNAGTLPATNFMGSTDNVDVAFRTNNVEVMRMTNGQRLLVGTATLNAPSTQRVEVYAATGDGLWAHSPNVGGWLGYETNFTVGTAGAIQGAGVWAANPSAGYTSSYAQSSGAATVAANINFSSVWIASYNLVDNASATFNPSALYAQLNNTNTTMGAGAFKNAINAYSNRGTTAGNPGYTVGVMGTANSQNEDAIGIVGRAFCSSGFTLGGYFEGNNYAGVNTAYAYVGGNDGFGATKITGTGAVAEIIPTEKHGRISLTCPESPEYWYQDYGTVTLVNGKAHVELDPILVDIVFIDDNNPIRVFCTPVDMLYFNGVTITNQTPTGFDLVELNGGTNSGKIDYQIIVKPKTNYGEGRFPQGPGPAYLKRDMEPAVAKAKNQPNMETMFFWPPDHIVYKYNPEDYVGIGEMIPAGPNAGKYKLGDGKYADHMPLNNQDLK